MEKIRISKVEDVKAVRRGEAVTGTLHLTPHHIIFSHVPPAEKPSLADVAGNPPPPPQKVRARELWITYPIISYCTFRSGSIITGKPPLLRIRCRDFTFVAFHFVLDKEARDVYDSIKALTCKLGRIEKLYAFSYRPLKPEKDVNGWEVYNAASEWRRQGISEKSVDRGWRISKINTDYKFSPTYPALLAVPSSISDNTINYAGKFRSRARIPVLTYLHPINNCSITRSSQPMAGFRGNRSIQDEKLVTAIFSSSTSNQAAVDNSIIPEEEEFSQSSFQDSSSTLEDSIADAEALEDELVLKDKDGTTSPRPKIYGAQQRNMIVDARPTVNAMAMQAVGLGSENMDNYPTATKEFLGIDNIHVMRESLNKVVDALKDSDITPLPPNRELLEKSGWLKHIQGLLEGSGKIAKQVGIHHSHVLIHCSDGWDRTSQLSALSQLLLDPYFRTMEGFIVLVEKDWLSFGHMFRHRSGFLNSEKWFVIQKEHHAGTGSQSKGPSFGSSGGPGNALENALLSAKGFFNKDNKSQDSIAESDSDVVSYDSSSPNKKPPGTSHHADKEATKVKETSPVFHQFLDATYQLLYQYPTRFEFNERFLRRLLYHLYSCQYGTFLYNNEKDRVEAKVSERTRSVWDYFISRKEQFTNEKYDPIIDDNQRGHERMIFPQVENVRWWNEVFGRTDAEMNDPIPGRARARGPKGAGVTTGFEAQNTAAGVGVPGTLLTEATEDRGGLGAGLAGLSLNKLRNKGKSSEELKREMEVEMQ